MGRKGFTDIVYMILREVVEGEVDGQGDEHEAWDRGYGCVM